MTVSPNPSNGNASVKVTLRKPMPVKIEFVDAGGRVISWFDVSIFETGESSFPLKSEKVPNGKYFIRAVDKGQIIDEKAILILR